MEDRDLLITAGFLEEAFHMYYEGLHRYAYTILKDSEAAGDAVQQVFMNIWISRDRIHIRESTRAYLFKAIYYYCIGQKKRERGHTPFQEEEQENRYVIGPDLRLECKELEAHIDRVIGSLPPKCKEVFLKSRMEGKSYVSIAAEEGISVKTVEAQISKALRVLRKSMGAALFLTVLLEISNT